MKRLTRSFTAAVGELQARKVHRRLRPGVQLLPYWTRRRVARAGMVVAIVAAAFAAAAF